MQSRWIFRTCCRSYSFGTAVGLLKSVIAFVLMIGANKLAQKYTDSKIF